MFDTEIVASSSSKSSKYIICFLILLLLILLSTNVLLFFQLQKKGANSDLVPVVVSSPSPVPEQNPSLPEDIDPNYLGLERLLLTQTGSNTQAVSRLFGFKFHPFHQDWECSNTSVVYTARGVEVTCSQKACDVAEGLLYPDSIMASRTPECSQELATREFPQGQFPRFTVLVEEFEIEDGASFDVNAKTPKGREYKIEIVEGVKTGSGQSKEVAVAFYSPHELTDMLSKYGGTFYGVDQIYAKYSINMEVYGGVDEVSEITEAEIIGFAEKFIDSIEFTAPVDLYR